MSSYSSSTSSSSSSSRIRSSTSPVLSNSSFGSLDYFASPFETPAPPRSSPDRNSELRIKYASFSDTPVMTFPVPQLHLGSQVQSPASPAPSTSSTSSTAESDLHGVGLAALAVPVSPSSPTSVSPGPSHSEFRPTPDMRKKLALHRRTVLFPEARVVNWARPFRAQGHAQPHVRQVSQDLLPSPQFDLEDLCQEAFQMKPVDSECSRSVTLAPKLTKPSGTVRRLVSASTSPTKCLPFLISRQYRLFSRTTHTGRDTTYVGWPSAAVRTRRHLANRLRRQRIGYR